jgi:hypothetical protein
LNIQNSAALGKRKRSIEEYLGYVYAHKYLSQNPIFRIFISDDFCNYKSDQIKHVNWIDKLASLKAFIPKILTVQTPFIQFSDENRELERAKENLLKLEKGIKEINNIVVSLILTQDSYIKINETKSDCLKNIFNLSKIFETNSLRYKDDNVFEDIGGNDGHVKVFYNLYEKNKSHCLNMINNLKPDLNVKFI